MLILSIDLGRLCGFCMGVAGTIPESWSHELRRSGQPNGLALGELAREMIRAKNRLGKPDMIVLEHWLPPKQAKSGANVEDALRMNGACNAIAGVWGVNVSEPFPSTVRTQVCGRPYESGDGLRGNRRISNTKIMVLDTMITLGYLPRNCNDDDRADAVCAWVWAQANFARVPPANFTLTAR